MADGTLSKRTFTYKAVGPFTIDADVYSSGDDGKPRPVILWIHGGALIGGDRTNIKEEQLAGYVSAGYIVVSPDYRLAPETKLPEIIQDLKDAYGWVREVGPALFNANPKKIALVGHSAGGYLTLMGGFALDPRPKALVSFYGYGDIVGDWYSKPDPFYCQQDAVSEEAARASVGDSPVVHPEPGNERGTFYLWCRQNGRWPEEIMGHDPTTNPDPFVKYCPLRNVRPGWPPTLLLHGDKDTDVPWEQSELMSAALEHAKIRHEFISITDGPHGFDGFGLADDRVRDAFERVHAFLNRHLRKFSVR